VHSVLAAAIAALLAFAAAKFQAAQPRLTETDLSGWAKQIESDAAVLRSRPALSDWRQRHAAERVELASYPALHSTDYEVDFLEQSRGRRLSRWLSDANTLPRVRRSAVLLLADVYVSRCQSCGSAALNLRLKELGARFESGCTPSDTNFSHNFSRQSERLNPEGPAGELAALLFLYDPCSLRGRVSWPELVIAKGQPILGQFGEDKWSPLMHYQLGRAYAAKLSFALPGGDPESGEKLPLNVVARRNTRNQAVTHFRAFLERDGLGGQRIAAWQEAWRLLAELPPSLINFGCGCE
jgi:hypothetical protein